MNPVRRSTLVGLLCGLTVGAMLFLSPSFFGLDHLIGDAMSRRLAARLTPDPDILIVNLNDKSMASLERSKEDGGFGRWPWTRELMARVIEEARIGGARIVAFDVTFDGPNESEPEGEARFAEAMRSMPVVLAGQAVDSIQKKNANEKMPQFQLSHRVDPSIPRKFLTLSGRSDRAMTLVPPTEKFAPSEGLGTIRFADARRAVAADPIGERAYIPSLALQTVITLRKLPTVGKWSEGALHLGAFHLPVDEERAYLLRWRSRLPNGTAEPAAKLAYSALDFDRVILASLVREEPTADPALAKLLPQVSAQFKNKIVIVGVTAHALADYRETSLGPITPGVRIHANAIDNLLHNDFNRAAPLWLTALITFVLATLFGALCGRISSDSVQVIALLLVLGAIVAGAWLALEAHYVIGSAAPLTGCTLTFVATTLVDFIDEKRRGVQLKATFGRYVSPQILDHILAYPEKVELGGERRDLTILFSDIRGFTSISEANEPEDVVEMLNEYLTEMVEILLRHGGTLDKFIGDAVMGFWNAPTEDLDHAEHSVACAVEMIEATARIRERWEQEGKASIRIGIGINSGEAVVGNIGAKQVFGYTVIGDAVNLASRLEGKNKDYATEIIISETTLEKISSKFQTKYLDEVKVKGKEKAVKIYEVTGWER